MLKDLLQEMLNATTEGCVVNRWISNKEPDVQEMFVLLKDKPGLNLSALYRAITNGEPPPFGKTMFNYHMRGECSCPRI
jgi:hypothetical protein